MVLRGVGVLGRRVGVLGVGVLGGVVVRGIRAARVGGWRVVDHEAGVVHREQAGALPRDLRRGAPVIAAA
jgi:hypothetical protein